MSRPAILTHGQTDSRAVYARPRVPSKAAGRRGTRRAWKRQNPPGIYMLVTRLRDGKIVDEYLMRW